MTFQTLEDNAFSKSSLNQIKDIHQNPTNKDMQNNAGITSICGLSNLGNTCFINASLQCLFATQPLKKIFIQTDFKVNVGSPMLEFMEQLQDIFVKVESGKYLILHLNLLHQVISKLHPLFGDLKQHDSQEFLSFVLNSIHDALNQRSPNKISKDDTSEGKSPSNTDWITNGVAKRLKMDLLKFPSETELELSSENMQTGEELAWSNYLINNQSVISNTMQGQFQSTVSCEKCRFVSYTYEPFMFLSLPIPYAMEREIVLTWVPSAEIHSLQGMSSIKRYLVVINKDGCLKDVKDKFLKMLMTDDSSIVGSNVVLAQVANGGNVNIMDERTLLSYINDNKDLYAIEVVKPSGYVNRLECENSENVLEYSSNEKQEVELSWHTCSICLEEVFDKDLHIHPICGGMMCVDCLEATIQFNHQENFACPICSQQIASNEYQRFMEPSSVEVKNRKVLVPVLFRRNSEKVNKFELFGHPTVFSLFAQTDSSVIRSLVQCAVLSLSCSFNFDIVVTDAAGVWCGLCNLRSSCTGCLIGDTVVNLKPGYCITIHFNHRDVDQIVQMHQSMNCRRNMSYVTLDECIAKFAEIEYLCCESSWYCPKCKCNQSATKTMNVSRWPDILIVHLKRFYYKGGKGCKIESIIDFPFTKLLPDILSSEKNGKKMGTPEYELYASICHSGTLNGGHYTSFVKLAEKWYYFNDDIYTPLQPTESNKDGVYVLFYNKIGLNW